MLSISGKKNEQYFKIAGKDAQTLTEAEKLRNLLDEMDRPKILILVACGTRWPNNGKVCIKYI